MTWAAIPLAKCEYCGLQGVQDFLYKKDGFRQYRCNDTVGCLLRELHAIGGFNDGVQL